MFFVNKNPARDYKKDFLHRLWATGMRDEEFSERFYHGEEVERSLKSEDAADPARYEQERDQLVSEAVRRYELYWPARPDYIREEGIQEGRIRPKKRRQPRKPKDVAGALERQEVLAHYLAEVASKDERITSFRKDVLSGRVLSREEALTFLSSPLAAAKKPRGRSLDRLLDLSYRVEEGQDDWGPYRKLVWGRRRSSKARPLLTTTKLIFPGDVVTSDDLRIVRRGHAIVFPHPHEENRFVVAGTGSIIADIASLAEDTLKGYPISKERGVWFILTGEFVHEDPVRISCRTIQLPELMSRTTITLEVESWLPPEEVLEQYRHAQHEVIGKTPRSLKRDTLAVFKFVNQRKGKPWRELFEAWNNEHPPSQRFKDRSYLYTTYTRAVENIAGIKPAKRKELKIAGTDPRGWPIYAGKWHLLHEGEYTGAFDSRAEAEAQPRWNPSSEVLTAEQLAARFVGRAKIADAYQKTKIL